MRTGFLKFLIFSAFSLTIVCCLNRNTVKGLKGWVGNYTYEETPVEAIAGYAMAMNWQLSIAEKGGINQGILEVNGQQTYLKLATDIKGDNNSIAIIMKQLIAGFDSTIAEGDTLFMLIRQNENLKTKWFVLEPRLAEKAAGECNCFIQERESR